MILTDPADPPSALPLGVRLGEFEIRRVLGAGGFGIVYLAFDHALEREVAIKEYLPVSMAGRTAALHVSLLSQSHAESFALGLRSFVNEARLLARFDHPSLVKVHRYWEDHNTAYMAMPFYAGHSLQRTRRYMLAPPAEPYVRSILLPLLGALDQLHREGVYHRDISPDNIIVAPDGRPVLLDFGAARRVLADMSVALTAILKPAYAPIEQYGETGAVKQGPWTDLYALGATLRHLLLGRAPAPATSRTVVDELEPLAAQALPGCSPAFLQCIDWMLQPRPADRPQSVAALRHALDACQPAPAAQPPAAGAADGWQTTQLLQPAAGHAHEATMFDPSLAPSTLRVTPAPAHDHTQVLPRDPAPAAAPAPASPEAPAPSALSDGRTEPTLNLIADDLAGATAAPAAGGSALPPYAPRPSRARPWPLVAGGIGAAALLGLALWLGGSRGPAPAEPALAGVPAESAAMPVPADAAPSAPAVLPSPASAPDAPALAQSRPLPLAPPAGRKAAAPLAAKSRAASAAQAAADAGGRPGLATSITRLPAADAPAAPVALPAAPAAPAAAPAAVAGTAHPPGAALASAAPGPAAANPAATKPVAAAPGPATMPSPRAPAPPAAPARAADRDNEPVLLQARALGPSERCEGRVLVALWACVDRHCKTDASLRDHPECLKLRREP